MGKIYNLSSVMESSNNPETIRSLIPELLVSVHEMIRNIQIFYQEESAPHPDNIYGTDEIISFIAKVMEDLGQSSIIQEDRVVTLGNMLYTLCDEELRKKTIYYLHTYQYDKALETLQKISGSLK